MRIAKSHIAKQILIMSGITAILALSIVYPFLPGEYDSLATPLSIFVQIFGAFGLLLSLVGLLWLAMPKSYYFFATTALYITTFIVIVLASVAFLSTGKIPGIVIIAVWIPTFFRLKIRLRKTKNTGQNKFSFIPIYLLCLPVFILIIQLFLTKPVTHWSRNKAIENAGEYISHLREFRTKYGYYPRSLQAMHKDYSRQITGIDKYHYLPYADSYNLSFEQPRFLFDVIGTREWVVYNPKDEHRAYSHTAWFLLLTPQQLEISQGWYSSSELEQLHWKYFLFD